MVSSHSFWCHALERASHARGQRQTPQTSSLSVQHHQMQRPTISQLSLPLAQVRIIRRREDRMHNLTHVVWLPPPRILQCSEKWKEMQDASHLPKSCGTALPLPQSCKRYSHSSFFFIISPHDAREISCR